MMDTQFSPLYSATAPLLSHVDALPPGTRLAEFEVQSLLGVGGFGLVYRAYDHTLQRAVAIKEYMPSAMASRQRGLSVLPRSPVDQQPYAAGLQSFLTEARILARFDHPSLVKVYRFWEANGTAYMVMPLYIGTTLKQARSMMEGPPPERWMRTVLWSILQALSLLHKNNLLHRDVSPDNIFLQDIGPPVLLDLGAARRTVSELTHKHTAVLKVNYAPIEQYAEADDIKEGAWTDLYSLAAVTYGFLRNEPPIPATFRVVRDRMPTMASLARTVRKHFEQPYSREFASAMDHALSIHPRARPQHVQAMVLEMRLLPPENLEEFDWWLELEESAKPGKAGKSRQLRDTVQQTVGDENQNHKLAYASRTGQLDSTWLDPDNQRVYTQHQSSYMDPLDTYAGDAYRARSTRWKPSLGRAALATSVAGLCGLLVFAGLQMRSPGTAMAKAPAANPVLAEKTKTVAPKVAVASNRKKKAEEPRHEMRQDTVLAQAPARKPARPVKPAALQPVKTAALPPAVIQPVSSSGGELCADSNFFSRPMCIYRECQKPENSRLAACVEERERDRRQRETTL